MRISLLLVVVVGLAACGGDPPGPSPALPGTSATSEPLGAPEDGVEDGESVGDAPPGGEVDPCTLLADDELAAAFVDLFEPPPGVRTSPGGTTDLCTWQDAAAGAVLRVELDGTGRIPVPPADPSCSDEDCPDPGLGIESRADLRETISYVVVRFDEVTVRVQESGLDLSGDELIALAAAVAGRLEG